LTAAETTDAIAPQELLVLMTNAFNVAKVVVLAVDEAWSRLQPLLVEAQSVRKSYSCSGSYLEINFCDLEISIYVFYKTVEIIYPIYS